jgi:hypothetical protein
MVLSFNVFLPCNRTYFEFIIENVCYKKRPFRSLFCSIDAVDVPISL